MKYVLLFLLVLPTLSFGQDTSVVNYRTADRIIPPDSIVLFPEVDASFPGGVDSLRRFMVNNFEFPSTNCFHPYGRIYVQMNIEVDGALSNAHVTRGFSKDFDQAALECILKMPNWIPAEHYGEVVKSTVWVPIYFGID